MSDSNTNTNWDEARLAALFEIGRHTDASPPEAIEENLEHLMSIPLEYALNQLPQSLSDKLRRRSRQLRVSELSSKAAIHSFGEMFRHPDPPLDLLKFAKEFGKAIVSHPGTVWPRPVGEILYYAAYAAALTRCRHRLGSLSRSDLQQSLGQLARRPWIGEDMRNLFEEAGKELASKP